MLTYLRQILLFVFIIATGSSIFSQGISMSPTRLFFTGNPGEILTEPVLLSNTSNIDYVFNVNIKDWNRELDGHKVYYDLNTLENSNASWISTVESSINLPAHSEKEIIVTMRVPQNASTTEVKNSMLFFTQIGKQKDVSEQQTGIGIIALFEFGLHVYYTPQANNTRSLDIVSIEEIKDELAAVKKVAIGIENDGNIVNDATVELEFTNTESGEEIKIDPINISMLPRAKQIVTFNIPENLAGPYLGVALIKMAGTNDLRVGEKNFQF